MAEAVNPCRYSDEEEEAIEESEEDEDFPCWSSPYNLFIPVFSTDSEESASDCSDSRLSLSHDLSSRMSLSPLFESYPETLDSHTVRVEDINDFLYEDFEEPAGNHFFVGSPISSSESSGGDLQIEGLVSELESSEFDTVIAASCLDTGGRASDRAPADMGLHLNCDFTIDDLLISSSEEFEWEEVDDDGLVDHGNILMMASIDDEETSSESEEVVHTQIDLEEASEEGEEDDLIYSDSNSIWEISLGTSNHGMTRNNSLISIEHVENISDFEDDQEAFINPSDYELQTEEFADDGHIIRVLPAAKHAVDKLPSIMLTEKNVTNSCAVCKDSFSLGKIVKQLPCYHIYHNDCILPWLRIRNTCPVCRYELITDDPEYERSMGRR